jgi:hypothetical protein
MCKIFFFFVGLKYRFCPIWTVQLRRTLPLPTAPAVRSAAGAKVRAKKRKVGSGGSGGNGGLDHFMMVNDGRKDEWLW